MGWFSLDYPVTRSFQWRWLGPLSFVGACIAILLLTVLNVALVGYETITIFSADFNTTQSFWYDTFMPYRKPAPGAICDSHVFNVGDTFTTNYTIFAWSIQSIEKANAGASGVSYNGTQLTNCDVTWIYVSGDLRTWSIDFSVVMSCKDAGMFDVSASTSFTISSLPGILAPLLGYSRSVNREAKGDGRSIILDRLIRTASEDLGDRVGLAYNASSGASPVVFSLQSSPGKFCPDSMGNTDCATKPPTFNVDYISSVDARGTLVQNYPDGPSNVPKIMDAMLTPVVLNLLQTVYAAVRLDLGIDSPNNFILHKEVMPQTLNSSFPVTATTPANPGNIGLTSHLFSSWSNPNATDSTGTDYSWMWQFIPEVVAPGPAAIQVVYLCHVQSLKSPGSLIISVLVAVLSMFSSGWAVYLLVLGTLAKRHPESNYCEAHLPEKMRSETPPPFPQPYHAVASGYEGKQ